MKKKYSEATTTRTKSEEQNQRFTYPVSDRVFKQVYDSPASLPGKLKWLTKEEDVRAIEKLLGMPTKTIGAPLWVSGDRKTCVKCKREVNWLDIVSSAASSIHSASMIAQVILGEQKYVNTEVPHAIEGLRCYNCGTSFKNLRSFKCHNWAYAVGDLAKVVQVMEVGFKSKK
ncbi:hypothetical protein [Mariniflexile sp. HMF6888]|uniref:hypothetical protein n=1 Tax=Mariniflexile sp. HMF6888 TaxID=3373086 RepID=UPI003796985E